MARMKPESEVHTSLHIDRRGSDIEQSLDDEAQRSEPGLGRYDGGVERQAGSAFKVIWHGGAKRRF